MESTVSFRRGAKVKQKQKEEKAVCDKVLIPSSGSPVLKEITIVILFIELDDKLLCNSL